MNSENTLEIGNDSLEDAKILWDFHLGEFKLEPADFILALGSHDLRVAQHAADVYLEGFAPLLVTSGGFGKVTRDQWNVSEGERFAEVARAAGVPSSAILVEKGATNTGENVSNTRRLLDSRGIAVRSGILVTKPYMSRRAFATAKKQWPTISWSVASPNLSFQDYPNGEVPLRRMINLMVGDLQRLKVYGENGFQIPTEIPEKVWQSYERLKTRGFDDFVIR